MSSSTSSQRGASRRTTSRTGSGGGRASSSARTGASASRTRTTPKRTPAKTASRPASRAPRRPAGPWVPIGVVAALVLLAWALYPALRLQYQTSRRVAGLEQQYAALRARNRTLKAEVAELKTPAGVAKAAREGLGFAKQGENVYVVMPAGGATAPSEAAVTGSADRSAAQVVLDAVFGVKAPDSVDSEP